MRLSFCYPTPERITEVCGASPGGAEELELVQMFGIDATNTLTAPMPRTGRELMNTSLSRTTALLPRLGGARPRTFRGLSHERDVSIKSGRRVAQVLRSAGFEVTLGDVDTNLLPFVQQTQPDVVWPLLHGSTGEDGSLTDLLSLTGVPFIGSEATGARVSWSKPIAKAVVARAGGTTPRLTTFTQALFRDVGAPGILELVSSHFTFPLVVKPASGGSALGVSVVDAPEHLPHAMVSAFAYDDVVMVEEYVDGIEVAVSVVDFGSGPLALPAVEIDTDGAYDSTLDTMPDARSISSPRGSTKPS